MRTGIASIAFAAAAAAAGPATAATFNQIVTEFNLVIFETLDSVSEVEGRAIVYGDLIGQSSNFAIGGLNGETLPASTIAGVDDDDGLFVGGRIDGNPKQINNGFDLVVADPSNVSAPVNYNGVDASDGMRGGQEVKALPQFQDELKRTSSFLATGLPATTIARDADRLVFSGGQLVGDTGVFFVDASVADPFFDDALKLIFDETSSDNFIINVAGERIDWRTNHPDGLDRTFGEKVLWNFFEATEIFTDRSIFGTVIAPHAHILFTSPIEGTLVAKSAKQTAEVHLEPFAGSTPTVVPLPGAFAFFIGGLAALGLVARRRAQA